MDGPGPTMRIRVSAAGSIAASSPAPRLDGVPVQMGDEFTADGSDDVYNCKGYVYRAGGCIDLINDVLIRIDLERCARPVPKSEAMLIDMALKSIG